MQFSLRGAIFCLIGAFWCTFSTGLVTLAETSDPLYSLEFESSALPIELEWAKYGVTR